MSQHAQQLRVLWDAAALELLGTHAIQLEAEARRSLGKILYDIAEEAGAPFRDLGIISDAEGAPLGFLLGYRVAGEYQVLDLVVVEAARRRGVGATLMEAAFERARGFEAEFVLLEVRRSNLAAIKLYRKTGFVAVRLRRRYYPDGEDAVELLHELRAGALAAFDQVSWSELEPAG